MASNATAANINATAASAFRVCLQVLAPVARENAYFAAITAPTGARNHSVAPAAGDDVVAAVVGLAGNDALMTPAAGYDVHAAVASYNSFRSVNSSFRIEFLFLGALLHLFPSLPSFFWSVTLKTLPAYLILFIH